MAQVQRLRDNKRREWSNVKDKENKGLAVYVRISATISIYSRLITC